MTPLLDLLSHARVFDLAQPYFTACRTTPAIRRSSSL